MELANVQRIGVESAYTDIEAFLNEYESEKTKTEYRRDVQEFFYYVHGKQLNELTKFDIEHTRTGVPIEKTHAVEYRNHLIKKAKTKNPDSNYEGTINRKMSGIRNLYKFLQGLRGYDVNYLNFALKSLKYNPDSYDVFTKEQVEEVAAEIQSETYGDELHALVYLATQTSFRVDTLVTLDWKKHIKKPIAEGTLHTVTVVGKRKQREVRGIDDWLIEKLVAIKQSNKVFEHLTVDNVHHAITKVVERLGYEGRYTTHSLRKAAPSFEMKTSNNIDIAMKQTGHRSVQVFRDHYVDKTAHLDQLAGIRMFRKVDESVFDSVSKEEILKLLKDTNVNVYNQMAYVLSENK